jgi:hypothetical protein
MTKYTDADYKRIQEEQKRVYEEAKKTAVPTTTPAKADPIIQLNQPTTTKKNTLAESRAAVEKIPIVGKTLSVLASPVTTGVLAGTLAALSGIGLVTGAFAAKGAAGAAVAKSAVGGTLMYKTSTGAIVGKVGASTIIPNTATAVKTTSFLTKVGVTTGALGTTMGIIGTYPFAGFIKEESLQTLGMATYTSMQQGNWELAERAITAQEEVLNPAVWEKIINAVPFLNVVRSLKEFYSAAKLKTEIDRELINQRKIQDANGETDTDMWKRIYKEREERDEQKRISDKEYYEEIKRNADEAAKNQRAEDTAYWNRIYAERDAKREADRIANEKYWAEVKKEWAKLKEDSRPSNLNFGLL